jgi:hypothetical protein
MIHETCKSHQLSRFAAFFIVARAKISTARSCRISMCIIVPCVRALPRSMTTHTPRREACRDRRPGARTRRRAHGADGSRPRPQSGAPRRDARAPWPGNRRRLRSAPAWVFCIVVVGRRGGARTPESRLEARTDAARRTDSPMRCAPPPPLYELRDHSLVIHKGSKNGRGASPWGPHR